MKFYRKDEIITKEGSRDRLLYILKRGRIGIFKGDVLVAEFNERGTVVGEMSAILNRPRTATIKALEDSYLISIDADIDILIHKYPDISKKIMKSLAKRLQETTDELWLITDKTNIWE